MSLAVDLRAIRINRGLSLDAASRQIGVSRDTLDRAENGGAIPQPRNALKIASFYGFKVTEIWSLDPGDTA